MSPQPEWTAERLDALEHEYGEASCQCSLSPMMCPHAQMLVAFRYLRRPPQASASDTERAEQWLKKAATLTDVSLAEQPLSLAAEFAAVRAEGYAAGLRDATGHVE